MCTSIISDIKRKGPTCCLQGAQPLRAMDAPAVPQELPEEEAEDRDQRW